MLKNIPANISPDLLKVLMEMGHGDELVLADANFPAEACGRRVVRADGIMIPELLKSILQLFPLDTYSQNQIALMQVVEGDPTVPVIWEDYHWIVEDAFPGHDTEMVERFDFYNRAKEAFVVVQTGETALYGNIILKKGVVIP